MVSDAMEAEAMRAYDEHECERLERPSERMRAALTALLTIADVTMKETKNG